MLGPLLFLIYINDIGNVVANDTIKLFADDTNLFIFGDNIMSVQNEAVHSITALNNWFIWRGGLVVGRRTCDLVVAGSRPGRDAAA